MAFPEDVVKQAWERSGGQCECVRRTHRHFYPRCGKPLQWKNRGVGGAGGWEIHRIDAFGDEVLSNCEILCWTCFEAV
ncbi:MAG: hypothetical protein ABIH70_10670 [Chloroflexota bacterium]